MATSAPADRYLTQREVCEALRISLKTLQVWRRQRRLTFYRFGHKTVRIRESELLRLQTEARV